MGLFDSEPCFKCGATTARKGRFTDDGKGIDPKADFRPICDDCGPVYTVVRQLSKGGSVDLKPGDTLPSIEWPDVIE
jgi:hypothetical protein